MKHTIPKGWRTVMIKDCCENLDNKRIPINSEERSKIKGDIPYYGANGVMDYINKWIFNQDLILLAEDGGHFLEYQHKPIAYRISGKSWVNNHAHILRVKKGYDFNFIFYSLVHKNIVPFISGGTRGKLNKSELMQISLACPEYETQVKIGELLETTNKAIIETDNIIKKSEKIKEGLMQQLFNDQNNGSKYPKVTIEKIAHVKRGASPRPIADPKWWSDSGVGWIRIEDVTKSNKYLKKTKQYLSEAGINNSVLVKNGELIMSICGSIGKPIILDMEACIHDGFVAFKDIKDKIDVEYFYYLLKYLEPVFSGMGQHGTQKNLNSTLVEKQMIPLPSIEEQRKIANMLSSLDMKVLVEEDKMRRLTRLKKGLMQKLLTGKIRVNT